MTEKTDNEQDKQEQDKQDEPPKRRILIRHGDPNSPILKKTLIVFGGMWGGPRRSAVTVTNVAPEKEPDDGQGKENE